MLLIGFLNPAFFGRGSCGCQRTKHGVFILLLNSMLSFTAGRRLGAVSWGPFEQNGGNLSGGEGAMLLALGIRHPFPESLVQTHGFRRQTILFGGTWGVILHADTSQGCCCYFFPKR